MNHRALDYELWIEVENVMTYDAVNTWTECFHAEPKLRHYDSLFAVERSLASVPADHITLDFTARELVTEADEKKAAEIAIQSHLEVVLVR